MGMHLLQKMGWKPGEGLGKEKNGSLQPLLLEVKLDKKGLVAEEEVKKVLNIVLSRISYKLIFPLDSNRIHRWLVNERKLRKRLPEPLRCNRPNITLKVSIPFHYLAN